jgi:hypothetical protein
MNFAFFVFIVNILSIYLKTIMTSNAFREQNDCLLIFISIYGLRNYGAGLNGWQVRYPSWASHRGDKMGVARLTDPFNVPFFLASRSIEFGPSSRSVPLNPLKNRMEAGMRVLINLKIISIVNKFNFTISFLNLHNFLNEVFYLGTKLLL